MFLIKVLIKLFEERPTLDENLDLIIRNNVNLSFCVERNKEVRFFLFIANNL